MTTPPYPGFPPGAGGPSGQQYPPPYGSPVYGPPWQPAAPGAYPYQGQGYPPAPPPPKKPRPALVILAVLGSLMLLVLAAFGIKFATSRNGSDETATASPTSTPSTSTSAQAAADQCASVSAPLVTLETKSPDEPTVRVPQPTGWERVTSTKFDVVRLVLRAPGLQSNGMAPTVVANIDEVDQSGSADSVFDKTLEDLKKITKPEGASQKTTTVCGLPAREVKYTVNIFNSIQHVQMLVVADSTRPKYLLTVMVQSNDPDNPTYQQDAATILKGFQVRPAGSR